jgi:hypothetical protein
MPRKKTNTITVVDWPKLRKGHLYPVRIQDTRLRSASNCFHVKFENLDPAQQGRPMSIDFQLPLRPRSRACCFLAACGIDATKVGTTIDLDQLVGRIVGFRPYGPEPEQFEFEPIPGPSTVETPSATEGAEMSRSESETTAVPRNDDLTAY